MRKFGILLVLALGCFPKICPAQDSFLTPFTLQVLAEPVPVLGSDGKFHAVYELQVANASSLKWEILSLEVLARGKTESVVKTLSGEELKKRMGLLGARTPQTYLDPGQTAIVWIALSFDRRDSIPPKLFHRLRLTSTMATLTEAGGETSISQRQPISVAPPLRGEKWVAGDGCCDSTRHLRAILPIQGKLFTAQRFAIDWERLGEGDKIFLGDPKKVESYFCYGKEVHAVADGRVVQMLDGLPNQIPGKLPEGIKPEEADGNHVIQEIAPGQYALYAHMIPGSLRVKTGEQLKKGQVIGLVGNSGNSSEPHLHFHVMDSPSALDSNGLPYVLDRFEALGKTPGTEAFDRAAAEGTVLDIQRVDLSGVHRDQLPMDQWVIRFSESED